MTLSPASAAPQEQLTLHWPTVAFLGGFHSLALLAPWYFSWSGLGIMFLLHWLFGGIGICLGFHRLFAHQSFQVPRWLAYGIAVLGALALEGGILFWVSGHRQHHAFSEDEIRDPYSARRGFWWSHLLWMVYPRPSQVPAQSYARDLARDPFYRWLDRNYLWLQLPLALLLWGMGGWSWVVYGIFVRVVLVWHTTWLVNSVTHLWGYQTFPTNDNARNNWWVAILTYGEGWHNNHHAYPRAAKAGWQWWEVDMTWWTIRTLQFLGLAQKVVLPTSNMLKG